MSRLFENPQEIEWQIKALEKEYEEYKNLNILTYDKRQDFNAKLTKLYFCLTQAYEDDAYAWSAAKEEYI